MNSKPKRRLEKKHRIRILLIGPLPPLVGGTTTSFQELVKVIANDNCICATIVNVSRSQKTNVFANFWVGTLCLIKSIAKIPMTDVVALNLSNSGFLIFGTLVLYICKLFNKPVLFRVFGGSLDLYWERGGAFRKTLLRNLFNSGTILLQTKLLTNYFQAKFPKAEIHWFSNSRIIQNPISRRNNSGKFRFIFLGWINTVKGVFEIIEASKKLDATRVEIHFFGPFMGGITIDDFNASSVVEYKGVLSYERIYSTLQEYDVLLLPTYHKGEGYPGVILEALACGVPVISTVWRAIPEIINHESNGILIPPNDVQALYLSMERLINDCDFVLKLKRESRKTALQFDNKLWYKRYIEHCRNIVENNKHR